MSKILLTLLGALYAISPYDIIPDFALGWGWLDDLLVLYLLWRFVYSGARRRGLGAGNNFKQYRRHFEQMYRQQNARSSQQTPPQSEQRQSKTPYEVLGVGPNVSAEELKQAYKKLVSKYHPDKVAHLGEEFKALAEERFKEIQEAYQQVKGG